MKKIFLIMAIVLMVFAHSSMSRPALSADDILKKARDRDDGSTYFSHVMLRLIGKNGSTRERHFYMFQKDMAGHEERAFMHFHQPADVRGVSFLIANYGEAQGQADDQWLFLPAFRKTRRIGSNDKRGSFMGSTFNYSDLDKVRVFDYTNTLVSEDRVLGEDAWLIERIPVSQGIINKSGYHKIRTWIGKKNDLILQQHYYNAKGIVFKTQQSTDVKKIQNVWTITKSLVSNLDNKKSSEMIFTDLVYDVVVSDKQVSKRALKGSVKASDIPAPP